MKKKKRFGVEQIIGMLKPLASQREYCSFH